MQQGPRPRSDHGRMESPPAIHRRPALGRVVLDGLSFGLAAGGVAALRQRSAAFPALGLVSLAPPLRGAVRIQIDDLTHGQYHSSARVRVGAVAPTPPTHLPLWTL